MFKPYNNPKPNQSRSESNSPPAKFELATGGHPNSSPNRAADFFLSFFLSFLNTPKKTLASVAVVSSAAPSQDATCR